MHPDYYGLMTTEDEDDRLLRDWIDKGELRYEWDRYSMGATILQLLKIVDAATPKAYSCYERRYLRLLATRLLDGRMAHARVMRIPVPDQILGLSDRAAAELAYKSARQARVDADKLLGKIDLSHLVPETSRYVDHVQAASHGAVPFTAHVEHILETRDLRALASLSQLSLVNLVYPTSTHSRLEHSLGTLAMTVRFARGLYNDRYNPIFRQIMEADDISCLLVNALVHDIGHYPWHMI